MKKAGHLKVKGKIKEEMERYKKAIKDLIKEVRMCVADMQKFLKDEEWVDLRLEVEDAIHKLVWITQEADILLCLERLLMNFEKNLENGKYERKQSKKG